MGGWVTWKGGYKMAFSITDRDNLKAAIASGTMSVAIGEQRVTYQSTSEMMKALSLIQKELDAASAASQGGSALYSVVDFRE